MPINPRYLQKFVPEGTYHIYNRTNNKEDLFREDGDRMFFLDRLKMYLDEYIELHAFCLLGNHFHLLITVRTITEICLAIKRKKEFELTQTQRAYIADYQDVDLFNQMIVRQFSKMFTSYAICFNKGYERSGNLFYRPFKRVLVDNDYYFLQLILYIHQNPVKHLLCLDFENYEWSSYNNYFDKQDSFINKTRALNEFKSLKNFQKIHRLKKDFTEIFGLLLENI